METSGSFMNMSQYLPLMRIQGKSYISLFFFKDISLVRLRDPLQKIICIHTLSLMKFTRFSAVNNLFHLSLNLTSLQVSFQHAPSILLFLRSHMTWQDSLSNTLRFCFLYTRSLLVVVCFKSQLRFSLGWSNQTTLINCLFDTLEMLLDDRRWICNSDSICFSLY